MKKTVFVMLMFFALSVLPGMVHAKVENEYNRALKCYYDGRYREAVSLLDEYIKKRPDPSAYYLKGYALYELGRFKEATENFDEAYLIDPNFSPEKSGLSEKFPKERPPRIKPPAARKHKRGVSKKTAKAAESGAAQPQKKEGPAPAKEPTKEAQPKKPAVQEVAKQKATTPATQTAAQKAGPKKQEVQPQQNKKTEVSPEKKAPAPAPRKADPGKNANPLAGISKLPSSQKAMPAVLPFAMAAGGLLGLIAGFAMIFLAIGIALYVYGSLCLFLIAKKLNVPAPWTAWIPFAQAWAIVGSAGKPWWWMLLFLVPLVNVIVAVYLWICITENLGRNKWLGLLMILPVVNFVLMGVLAFSKTEKPDETFIDELHESDKPNEFDKPGEFDDHKDFEPLD